MDIKSYLQNLGIKFKSFTHPPVFTCEEAERYNKEIGGIHCKNLFLKDNSNFYLAILPSDKKLDFKILDKLFNSKLKFANETDLKQILNLTPGAVSPFALIYDKEHKVMSKTTGQRPVACLLIVVFEHAQNSICYFLPHVINMWNSDILIIDKEVWNSDFVSVRNSQNFSISNF